MIFQFGLCSPNISNPKTENSLECNFVLELAEHNFQSWTFWDTSNGFEFWNEVQIPKYYYNTVFGDPEDNNLRFKSGS